MFYDYLDPQELETALKGATITGVRVMPNGRDMVIETTVGCVEMTNELQYKFRPVEDSRTSHDATSELTKMEKPDDAHEIPFSC